MTDTRPSATPSALHISPDVLNRLAAEKFAATIRRLNDMADDWERIANINDRLGDEGLELGDGMGAGRAYGSRDAHRSVARQLREALR